MTTKVKQLNIKLYKDEKKIKQHKDTKKSYRLEQKETDTYTKKMILRNKESGGNSFKIHLLMILEQDYRIKSNI